MPIKKITIEVELDDIENLMEFAKLNLDMINVDEFEDYHKSLCAVQDAVRDGRNKAAKAINAVNTPS